MIKINILIFSNSLGRNYGYSVVSDGVSDGLQQAGHQVYFYGMQDITPPYVRDNGVVQLGLQADPWGSDVLEDYLRIYNIDVLALLVDVWLDQLQYIPPTCKRLGVKLLSQITANSYPLSPFLGRFIAQCDHIVAPSRFVYKTITDAGFKNVTYIPHGINPKIFKPMPKAKKEMREKLKIEDKELVVGSVMRNKGLQKSFPILFHGWKQLIENVPELKQKGILICVTDYKEGEGMKLDMLRQITSMEPHIRFVWTKPVKDGSIEMTWEGNPEGMPHNANMNFPHIEMAKFYNMLDMHVISSSGESFNYPTLEAMTCGTPCIFGNHTTGPELITEEKPSPRGLLVNVQMTQSTPLMSEISHIDPLHLTEQIHKLHIDNELRKLCSENAREFSKAYAWEKIIPMWVKLLEEVNNPKPANYATGDLGI